MLRVSVMPNTGGMWGAATYINIYGSISEFSDLTVLNVKSEFLIETVSAYCRK